VRTCSQNLLGRRYISSSPAADAARSAAAGRARRTGPRRARSAAVPRL